jgi:hypothetical protein
MLQNLPMLIARQAINHPHKTGRSRNWLKAIDLFAVNGPKASEFVCPPRRNAKGSTKARQSKIEDLARGICSLF